MTVSPDTMLAGGTVAWDNTAMSGTAKRVSEWCELDSRVSSYSFQMAWANGANVLGAFEFEESNDGITPTAAGIASPTVNNNTNAGATVSRNTSARYVRCAYTNTSGTGTLGSLIVVGKRGKLTGEQQLQLDAATADVATAQTDATQALADAAAAEAFTPAVAGDWDGTITTITQALNELAARVRILEP